MPEQNETTVAVRPSKLQRAPRLLPIVVVGPERVGRRAVGWRW